MQLRVKELVQGLSKSKVKLLLAILVGVIGSGIIYAMTREQSVQVATSEDNSAQNNLARQNSADDFNNILGNPNNYLPKIVRNTSSAIRQVGESAVRQTGDSTSEEDHEAMQELKAAMKAPLSSNQLSPQGNTASNGSTQAGSQVAQADNSDGLSKDDPAMNGEKRNFIKSQNNVADNVLSTSLSKPIAPLVLSMGTKISAQLDQQINSDLPGQLYAHVTRDVFDSRTHSNLLIPAGSNLVGSYDNAIAYGQSRLLVAWTRVNLPNGQWLDLQGMGAADPVGSGFSDLVDNHYWKIFGATFLTSVLAVAPQLVQPQQSGILATPTIGQTVGQSVGTQIAQTGTMLLQKNINIQPTIHIRAGFEFTVEVNRDIIFPASYTGNSHKLN